MNYWILQCEKCGKFVAQKETSKGGGASWVFVPEVEIPGSYEEDKIRCKKCTEKYGRIFPNQRVVIEMCSGVY